MGEQTSPCICGDEDCRLWMEHGYPSPTAHTPDPQTATPAGERDTMIARTCPRCRHHVLHHTRKPVPPAFGADTPAAVLVNCTAGGTCTHQWRAILRASERGA